MPSVDVYVPDSSYLAYWSSNTGASFVTNPTTFNTRKYYVVTSAYYYSNYWKFKIPALPSGAVITQIAFWGNVTAVPDSTTSTSISFYRSANQTSSFTSAEVNAPSYVATSVVSFNSVGYSTVFFNNPGVSGSDWVIFQGKVTRPSFGTKTSYTGASFSTSAPSGSFLRVTYTVPTTTSDLDYNNLFTFTA